MSSRETGANEVLKRRRLTSEPEPEEVLVPETVPYVPDTAMPEDPIPDTLEMDEQSQNLLELSEVDTDEEEVKHESESDFESPNLLARNPRRGKKETLRREGSVKPRGKEEEVSPMKKQKSVTKSANRWGMKLNPITASQKERLRNQEQVRELDIKNAHFYFDSFRPKLPATSRTLLAQQTMMALRRTSSEAATLIPTWSEHSFSQGRAS